MDKRKIYLAGSITNRLGSYWAKFKDKKDELEQGGFLVMSPHILPIGFNWEDYLRISKEMLKSCDEMYVLKDWEKSKGTIEEIKLAKKLGLKIWYEGKDDVELNVKELLEYFEKKNKLYKKFTEYDTRYMLCEIRQFVAMDNLDTSKDEIETWRNSFYLEQAKKELDSDDESDRIALYAQQIYLEEELAEHEEEMITYLFLYYLLEDGYDTINLNWYLNKLSNLSWIDGMNYLYEIQDLAISE